MQLWNVTAGHFRDGKFKEVEITVKTAAGRRSVCAPHFFLLVNTVWIDYFVSVKCEPPVVIVGNVQELQLFVWVLWCVQASPVALPRCCAGSWWATCILPGQTTRSSRRCPWTSGWTRFRSGCGRSIRPSANLPPPSRRPAAERRTRIPSCSPDCRSAWRRGPAPPPSPRRWTQSP